METSEILKRFAKLKSRHEDCLTIFLQANIIRLSKVEECPFRRFVSINLGMTYVT